MFQGEDFFLQIDAHSSFDADWDRVLLEQMSVLPSRSILGKIGFKIFHLC
jgi:hypothetical protein